MALLCSLSRTSLFCSGYLETQVVIKTLIATDFLWKATSAKEVQGRSQSVQQIAFLCYGNSA